MQWAFYPAFLGTLISIVGWVYMARKEHDRLNPLTLSELGAARADSLRYFRTILWTCGPLFALTVFLFIVPKISHPAYQTIAWTITLVSELLLGVFPAKEKTFTKHSMLMLSMSGGMLAMAGLFIGELQGSYRSIESLLLLVMCILAVTGTRAQAKKKPHIAYELGFIFSSHITILVAALALR